MSQKKDHAVVELTLNGDACTDAALAFVDPDNLVNDPIWIPRSQIDNLDEVLDGLEDGLGWGVREVVEIKIPIWLVEEKGLDIYAEEVDL